MRVDRPGCSSSPAINDRNGGQVTRRCRVLLVSGSLRRDSTTPLPCEPPEWSHQTGSNATGLDRLPHYNPDDDVSPLDPAVADLRAGIRGADAVVFSTPEYAGALPGSFKNLLDWTVGDDQTGSIYEKPVGWVNVSAAPTGAADAHESLRKVLGYIHASVVADACASIPVPRHLVGADGIIDDPAVRSEITRVLTTLASHVAGLERDRA